LRDRALNLFLSLGGHVELCDYNLFNKPAVRVCREYSWRHRASRGKANGLWTYTFRWPYRRV